VEVEFGAVVSEVAEFAAFSASTLGALLGESVDDHGVRVASGNRQRVRGSEFSWGGRLLGWFV